jgi:hypothetical protein
MQEQQQFDAEHVLVSAFKLLDQHQKSVILRFILSEAGIAQDVELPPDLAGPTGRNN